LCYVLCFEFCVICCSYSLIVLLFTFFNFCLFIFFLMFAFNMLYMLFFLFLQVVDASFSLSIVEHSIMELNLQIYLNQHHCETKKCSHCYYYKPKCMEVDNDLNMTFCKLGGRFYLCVGCVGEVWHTMCNNLHPCEQTPISKPDKL
jgi:hypothetical protein